MIDQKVWCAVERQPNENWQGLIFPIQGRMAKADSLVGFSPLSYDLRQSVVGGDSQSGIVDPPNPNNAREFRTPSSISELGSNPIHGGPIGPTGRIEKAESRSQTARRSKAEAIPRAILDTTEQGGRPELTWIPAQQSRNIQL